MVIWQVFTLRLDRGVTSICLHNKRQAKGSTHLHKRVEPVNCGSAIHRPPKMSETHVMRLITSLAALELPKVARIGAKTASQLAAGQDGLEIRSTINMKKLGKFK